jgi:hypothetical protein
VPDEMATLALEPLPLGFYAAACSLFKFSSLGRSHRSSDQLHLCPVSFIFVASMIFCKIIDLLIGNRVSPEVELEGLDVPGMGVAGYAEYLPRPAEGSLGGASVSV